jgi:hypothetical protein
VTVTEKPNQIFYRGFNQVDKRKVDKYKEMWNIPDNLVETLKYFTGELKPYIKNVRDKEQRRMFLDEIDTKKVEDLLIYLESNRVLIVSDVLKGRGVLAVEWVLIALSKKKDNRIETEWSFRSINEVINHYSKGMVKLSPRGSIIIGRLTAQRKGGDGGRETANCLQFKFDPLELLYL